MPTKNTNLRDLEIRDINDWKGAIWHKVNKSGKTTWHASLYGNIVRRSSHEKALEALAIMDMKLNGPGKTSAVQEYYRKYSHTFEEAYVKHYSRVSVMHGDKTDKYAKKYRSAMAPLMNLRMHELKPEVIEEWFSKLLAAGRKPSTCHKYLNECSSVMRTAVRLEWLHMNPCDYMNRPKKVRRKKVHIYSADEIKRLMSCFKNRKERIIAACFFHLGVRISECLALRVEDVDMTVGVVSIRVQCRYEGRPACVVGGTKSLKTESATRDIVMTPYLYTLMKEWLGRRHASTKFLFHDGLSAYSVKNWRTRWRNAHRKAGIPLRTPHVARHTAGTMALRSGVPEAMVAKMMGHRDATTTRKHYEHAVDADSHLVASALGKAYDGACDERAAAAISPRT